MNLAAAAGGNGSIDTERAERTDGLAARGYIAESTAPGRPARAREIALFVAAPPPQHNRFLTAAPEASRAILGRPIPATRARRIGTHSPIEGEFT